MSEASEVVMFMIIGVVIGFALSTEIFPGTLDALHKLGA